MQRLTGFLTSAMRERERGHRRYVLWGIGALLLLSLSPVLGHHLSARLDAALMGQDHVWIVCMIALHALLAPVHALFHVLLVTGLFYAVADRLRATWRLRQTLRMLGSQLAPHSGAIGMAIATAGVPSHVVRVVRGLPNPAFTAGWWSPTIYIAEDIGAVLSDTQLAAVLAHEGAHVRRRDPLRLSLLRFLGCTLFWIPAFRRLAADMADEAEIAADDAAAGERPLELASAILALAAWPVPPLALGGRSPLPPTAIVGVVPRQDGPHHHDALLERRVRRLAGETAVVSSHLTRRSLLGAAAMLSAVWLSGIVVAHPMPMGAATGVSHCAHAHLNALSHLFCRADHERHPGQRCPHERVRQGAVRLDGSESIV